MAAASAATGFRTWLQTHHFGWLTPTRRDGAALDDRAADGAPHGDFVPHVVG